MASRGKIVVGMSGGVDSSVAAALLQRDGYEVLGVTLRLWPASEDDVREDRCCGPNALSDARRVAGRLGIPHRVLDETPAFEREVLGYFVEEYRRGRTPNPCVACNPRVKFDNLLRTARAMGADFLATGHYARVERTPKGSVLRRAKHLAKDQSYFLHRLTQEQLGRLLLPLGELDKEQVRETARALGLGIHAKGDSQDLCFLPENDYAAWLKQRLGPEGLHGGEIVSSEGRTLGRHEGIEFFTVGQRKGIRVDASEPLYVLGVDAKKRRVIVGEDAALWRRELVARDCVWGPDGPVEGSVRARIQIRQRHEAASATLEPTADDGIKATFDAPQRAITPGQAAVFYDDDRVLGGGWIAG
ncbi:MAG: tRNA 2-thiouridine(34) synthase MnmA [Verrucomicrobiae bacterium]|nr:tRNA 2-thiouridine(34) synthase MnmA [Verrucomicrobiae bacterium]